MQETTYYGDNLIFIISQPRSGSTLLQRILAGHSDIQTSAETWLMLHPLFAHKVKDIETIYNSEWASLGVTEFIDNYTDGAEIYDNAIRLWANTIYSNALKKGGKTIFLDKTPRYFYIIPELYRLFPKAKFIFLIRNPMAVLASELKTYIKGNWPFISEIAPDLLEAPKLILEGIDLLASDAIVIHYEEFVLNPDENIAHLCRQLEIEYSSSMLDYSKTEVPKGRLNDPVGIHQHTKASNKSVDKWKDMASDPQAKHFATKYLQCLGKDLIGKLGYSYEELEKLFNPAADNYKTTKGLFPWELAIIPRKKWKFKKIIIADFYFSIQEKGPVLGRLNVYKNVFIHLMRNIFGN